jgi:hypothetical protein
LIKLLSAVFISFAFLCQPACRSLSFNSNRLDSAEELLRQEKYDEAINLYKKHMENRLAVKNRPTWENPYFYYLLIGDIELRRSNVNAALENYKLAQAKGIHLGLISDRMRYIASWYEEKNEHEEAIAILKANRDLDPLLFDAMLDRISKDLVQKQDQQKNQ